MSAVLSGCQSNEEDAEAVAGDTGEKTRIQQTAMIELVLDAIVESLTETVTGHRRLLMTVGLPPLRTKIVVVILTDYKSNRYQQCISNQLPSRSGVGSGTGPSRTVESRTCL